MSGSILPGGPLDIPSTQALVQERIRRGEISQHDVDILKKGYRWMIVSAALGTAAGIPVWYSMRRRKPPISLGVRLAAAWFVGSTGSFLGFTIGGAAAALEVNNHMADSQRKMKVFEDIMVQSKRMADEQRRTGIARNPRDIGNAGPAGIYDGPAGSDSSGSRMDEDLQGVSMTDYNQRSGSAFDPEVDEQRQEYERERQYGQSGPIGQATSSTWERIRAGEAPSVGSPDRPSDPSARPGRKPFVSSSGVNAPMSDSAASPSAREGFGRPSNLSTRDLDIKIDTLGSKKGDLGSRGEIYGLGGAVEERDRERAKEKREFEMLMEKERNAGGAGGREDGFEKGKW